MSEHAIELVAATDDNKTIFENLMQLYQYDSSEYNGEDCNSHGRYLYTHLDHYWTGHGQREEGRRAYLITVDGKLAGFLLLIGFELLPGTTADHSVAEFFIMRKWRRRGIGRQVMLEIFRRYRGRWQITQERCNVKAQAFWRSVVAEATGGNYTELDSQPPNFDGPVQIFTLT
ncbi:MAG TPA: GNAT family N-acetyltransferase [Symbiobacteriaceae bacterium]|nr:GNAT family N-acetyltransferase [Symbiobacteriaceae bacterium]